MAHVRRSHGTLVIESWHTCTGTLLKSTAKGARWHSVLVCATWSTLVCACDMIHTWHIYICDMTHSYVRHDSFICATWLIHMCDMTHSYLWEECSICVTWHVNMCNRTYTCVTWVGHELMHVWHDVRYAYAWHDVTRLMQTRQLTRLYLESLICRVTHMTGFMHTNDMTQAYWS